MCGIAGFLKRPGTTAHFDWNDVARAMTATLLHRGPDDSGEWCDPDAGIALGHRRLSIVDLSPTGHQPMVSADGRFVITYNGEVYSFREIRQELESHALILRGSSDTEVLLEAVSTWGLDATLPRLIGMFAFALWDRQERTLTIVRDRLGVKPLYWSDANGFVSFASELKALHAHPAWTPAIDRGALSAFMRHNYIPAPFTIYQGVWKLEPGTYAVFKGGGQVSIQRYWDLREVVRSGREARRVWSDETRSDLEVVMRDAIERRMIADVPLGALLSGGIDSSLVTALMQSQRATPVRTFSIGFADSEYDEAPHARAIARHLGTDHTELYVQPRDALDLIPRLTEWWDEPFADSSQVPTYLVCQLTRQHVKVVLSGDGGDELFCGYTRYAYGAGLEPGSDRDATYRQMLSHWPDPSAVVLRSTERRGRLWDDDAAAIAPHFVDRMQYLDTLTYLPDDILTKVDRASMAVGLEARVPLLDHRLVEFAWQLPLEVKLRDGQGKWALRQVLARYVPPALFERPKMGFGMPVDHWLRGPLRSWADALLEPARLDREGLLASEPIRKRWDAHRSGRANWAYPIWNVLIFQSWLARHPEVAR